MESANEIESNCIASYPRAMDHDHLIVGKVVVIRFLTQYRNMGGQTTWTKSHPSHTFITCIDSNESVTTHSH